VGDEIIALVPSSENGIVHEVYDFVSRNPALPVFENDIPVSGLLLLDPGLYEVETERYLLSLLVYDRIEIVHSPFLVSEHVQQFVVGHFWNVRYYHARSVVGTSWRRLGLIHDCSELRKKPIIWGKVSGFTSFMASCPIGMRRSDGDRSKESLPVCCQRSPEHELSIVIFLPCQVTSPSGASWGRPCRAPSSPARTFT